MGDKVRKNGVYIAILSLQLANVVHVIWRIHVFCLDDETCGIDCLSNKSCIPNANGIIPPRDNRLMLSQVR